MKAFSAMVTQKEEGGLYKVTFFKRFFQTRPEGGALQLLQVPPQCAGQPGRSWNYTPGAARVPPSVDPVGSQPSPAPRGSPCTHVRSRNAP